jgi:hypothetical protein
VYPDGCRLDAAPHDGDSGACELQDTRRRDAHESALNYPGIEVGDALAIAERVGV